ncbi:universal stress protein [Methylocella tundrae]|uniref:Universal stress protein UspA n=1 Tax=Methylocella tundrae TaxID=227605 RepID=A0A4U8Z5Y9_METTU|nr:universal stress protein [Methylocella tundrae]WPP04576.1 universal stress protein [Methylocella tundrae]VFU10998.1 Universal stress protein UspA [Methylocella tundrae]
MKSILIPVEDHAHMEAVMETALLLAHAFNSYMEGIAVGPDIAEFVAADFALSGIVLDDRTRRDFVDHSRRMLESFMARRHVERPRDEGDRPTFGWTGDALVSDSGVGEYGRIFDVITVGRPGQGPRSPRKSTLEAVLFESGRPVLIAPPEPPQTLGERIAIAWNGTTDTARSIAFAMPLITRAQDVVILTVPGPALPGPSDEQLAKSLRRHGAQARVGIVGEAENSPAAALLEAAAALGADLLIKGGYTRSRLRQLIFGKVTSEILAEANLPVFMAH